MQIGYTRVSKADGSHSVDLQRDALMAEGVEADRIYEDSASGAKETGPAWRRACGRCATVTC